MDNVTTRLFVGDLEKYAWIPSETTQNGPNQTGTDPEIDSDQD